MRGAFILLVLVALGAVICAFLWEPSRLLVKAHPHYIEGAQDAGLSNLKTGVPPEIPILTLK